MNVRNDVARTDRSRAGCARAGWLRYPWSIVGLDPEHTSVRYGTKAGYGSEKACQIREND